MSFFDGVMQSASPGHLSTAKMVPQTITTMISFCIYNNDNNNKIITAIGLLFDAVIFSGDFCGGIPANMGRSRDSYIYPWVIHTIVLEWFIPLSLSDSYHCPWMTQTIVHDWFIPLSMSDPYHCPWVIHAIIFEWFIPLSLNDSSQSVNDSCHTRPRTIMS